MKVFVTGHRGYIGSHLVDVLKQEGHTVVGCDLGLFDGCAWEPVVRPDVELVKDTASRTPLVPYNAAGQDNAPMVALTGACKKRGLLPFVNGSRTHVVPALNITDDEARYGLALLDEALTEVESGL